MRTLLDYVGLNPLRPLVAFGGDDSGGGGGGGGDSRPDEAKALDEPTVSVGYGSGQVDPGLASAVGLAPTGGYSGITGPSAYEISEALGGSDRDPTPTPAPVVDYSDVDLSGLPSLPQEIPVEYKDTTSGIEKVVDFYSPPAFDMTDPNEPLVQDGEPFSGIAYGEFYESGQPVGAVNVGDIAALGELELPDLSLTPATATTDLEVGPSLALPTVISAVDPVQTGLEEFEEQQYLSFAPSTVPDYELGLSPEELSDVLTRADAYYGDTGYDEMSIRGAPSSEPLSVAEQVAQYDSDVNLDLRDIGRDLESGKISVADVFSPSLTDDDMGLPDISVDEAMFTRGDLGRSDVVGGTSIPLDPMDPYSATLADDVVDEVVTSTPVPDVDIPSHKNVIDAVVAGVLTGTPVEGFDVLTSKVGMPRTGIQGVINDILGSFALFSGLATGDPAKRQEIADMLSSGSGRAVYNSKGELIGAVDNATGEYVGYPSNEGGYIRTDDGQLIKSGVDVPEYPDPFVGGESDDGCPAGYEFDATIGQCVPIGSASSGEEPKISLGEVERPVVTTPRPPRPPSEPVEGMTIRAPRQFNVGGPVTPNIDRFLGSLRG